MRYIENLIRRYYIYIIKEDFLAGFYDAFQVTITSDNIKFEFAKVNLILLDFNNVFSELEVLLIVFTPTVFPLTFVGFILAFAKALRNIRKVIR